MAITPRPIPSAGDSPLHPPVEAEEASQRPAFLVTVDTEGDNLWSRPRVVTSRNAECLPRFQSLCEKYNLRPTYLVNWEMARSPAFVELGKDVLRRNAGEIGMHLHAWNSPPSFQLTTDDDRFQPYLIEYPADRMREKVKVMTETLAEVFGLRPTSHRAGRWSFDATYARALIERGYTVDCSVTPHVSWQFCKGDPNGHGGTDYVDFPETPYFVNTANIRQPGESRLLELPVTVLQTRRYPAPVERLRSSLAASFLGTRIMRKAFPNVAWLMPTGSNGAEMLRILDIIRSESRPYAQFVVHSSELLPGGSPQLPDARSIDRIYHDIEALFAAAKDFIGQTLAEFRAGWPSNA